MSRQDTKNCNLIPPPKKKAQVVVSNVRLDVDLCPFRGFFHVYFSKKKAIARNFPELAIVGLTKGSRVVTQRERTFKSSHLVYCSFITFLIRYFAIRQGNTSLCQNKNWLTEY